MVNKWGPLPRTPWGLPIRVKPDMGERRRGPRGSVCIRRQGVWIKSKPKTLMEALQSFLTSQVQYCSAEPLKPRQGIVPIIPVAVGIMPYREKEPLRSYRIQGPLELWAAVQVFKAIECPRHRLR